MTDAILANRYGTKSSRRRLAWIWGGSAGIVVVALVAWFVWANPLGVGPRATALDKGYVMSDDFVTVSFTLTVTAGHSSACAVQALNTGFATVGWKVVTFPAGDGTPTDETVTVRVISPATTGLVSSCWLT